MHGASTPRRRCSRPRRALRLCFRDTPPGDLDQVLARMEDAVQSSSARTRSTAGSTSSDAGADVLRAGYPDKALEYCMRVREGAGGGRGPDPGRFDPRLVLGALRTAGPLGGGRDRAGALRKGRGGLADSYRDLAGACVAQLRGDAARRWPAPTGARRGCPGPVVFFHRAATQLIPPLVAVGRSDRAGRSWTRPSPSSIGSTLASAAASSAAACWRCGLAGAHRRRLRGG